MQSSFKMLNVGLLESMWGVTPLPIAIKKIHVFGLLTRRGFRLSASGSGSAYTLYLPG